MKNILRIIVILILLLSGCTKDDPVSDPMLPLPPTTEGTWTGVASPYVKMTLHINQNKGEITGSGTAIRLRDGLLSNSNIEGTTMYPNVTISFGIQGYAPIEIRGKFANTNQITAELNGSGFYQIPITLIKQE